jgi:hypothetical protein
VVLLDNITSLSNLDDFASLITAEDLTGLPPFGRDAVSVTNNYLYIITSNGVHLDSDLAPRFFTIKLTRPKKYISDWLEQVRAFIINNRELIFAELIDLLKLKPDNKINTNRFSAFCQKVLYPVCGDDGLYNKTLSYIAAAQDDNNSDNDLAEDYREIINSGLASIWFNLNNKLDYMDQDKYSPDTIQVFISSRLIGDFLQNNNNKTSQRRALQKIREIAINSDALPEVTKPNLKRVTADNIKISGLAWRIEDNKPYFILNFQGSSFNIIKKTP